MFLGIAVVDDRKNTLARNVGIRLLTDAELYPTKEPPASPVDGRP
jgi:hypothetical protein